MKLKAKVFEHTFLLSFLVSVPIVSHAAPPTYECYRPAKAGEWQKTRKPRGNWGPQHNTRNWTYAAVEGEDIYRRNGNMHNTVGTRCKKKWPGKFNFGVHKIDLVGNQDWCARYKSGWPEAVTQPRCTSGYSLSPDKKTCIRPGRPGRWQKTRKPRGNWGPQHNTRNWTYAAVEGEDIYRRNGNMHNTVGTRCKKKWPGKFNFGTHKIDLVGKQDWCANWRPAISAHTKPASCPAGFGLSPINTSSEPSTFFVSNNLQNSVIGSRGHIHYQNGKLRQVWGNTYGAWIDLTRIDNTLQNSVIPNRGHIQYKNGYLREVWGNTYGRWINLKVKTNRLQDSVIPNRGHIQYKNGYLREVWGNLTGNWIRIRKKTP